MADEIDPIEWSRRAWEDNKGPGPDHFGAMAAVFRLEQLIGTTLDRALREHGVSRTGFQILAALSLEPDRTLAMGQLSKRLLLHPTTVSLIADKLQARQLVARSPSETDRRTTLASLTDEGAQMLSVISETLSEINYGFEGLSSRMAVTLTEVIRQVRRDMGDSQDC